jgi:aflatoxin B1 aldehyde reductase
MLHHSKLGDDDGLLLGASKVHHLEENLKCCAKSGPLSEDVQMAFDKAWAATKPDAFAFWRGYSIDMPGKDDLDPGASYVAGGKK